METAQSLETNPQTIRVTPDCGLSTCYIHVLSVGGFQGNQEFISDSITFSGVTWLYNLGTENCTIGGYADNGSYSNGSFTKNANNIYLRLNDTSTIGSSSAACEFSNMNTAGYSHLVINLENVYCSTTGMSLAVTFGAFVVNNQVTSVNNVIKHYERTFSGTVFVFKNQQLFKPIFSVRYWK